MPSALDIKQVILLVMPFLLIATTALVFKYASNKLGREKGYLAGFGFYWSCWCLLFPWLLLGNSRFSSLLIDRVPLFSLQNWAAELLWAIITGVTLVMYGKKFAAAAPALILLAILPAIINGFCEEMLWRGMYVQAFPNNIWLGLLFPAAGFALWHLVPQSIFPAENVPGFILSTLFLGLAYGFIAYQIGSAKWSAISHSLNGILALSGMLAPTILNLIRRQHE